MTYALEMMRGRNQAQQAYLEQSLAWVHARHGDDGIVYLLGHHPTVMGKGTGLVAAKYRPMVKGVFGGHNHHAKSTDGRLFTNLGALSYDSNPAHNFMLAQVDSQHPEVRIDASRTGINGKHFYTPGDNHKVADASQWN